MTLRITAPCGIDCFNCELFEDNITEEFAVKMAEATKIPKEHLSCKGCQGDHQCVFLDLEGKECKTKKCAAEKNVEYCFECTDFPCELLMPLADGAARLPHNIKLYNLCTMKKIGVDAWKDKAKDIRKTYFGTKSRNRRRWK